MNAFFPIFNHFFFNCLCDYFQQDYGGELESFETFHEEQRKRLETEYRDWLIDSSHLKQKPKEKKADKKSQLLDANDNPITSLSALEID